MKRVYVHRLADWYDLYMDGANEALLASFAEVVSEGSRAEPFGEDELIQRMKGANIILSLNGMGTKEITENVLKKTGTVELICISHWWEQFADAEKNTGIRVIEGSNCNTVAVAEWTVCAALMGIRKLSGFDAKLKAGSVWCEPRRTVGLLCESTVGLVALGRIGRYVAKYMRSLGARVIACDKLATEKDAAELDIELAGMDDVFKKSDVISLHLPVLPSTKGLIGAEHFAKIKDGAVFINSSRAAVYDENALVAELQKGRFDAYLDVFSVEPLPLDHPFRRMTNVLITPHLAGDNIAMFRRCGREAILTIKEYCETGRIVDRKFMFP
ncbi:MAG: hydroxyacid dehydrogenase [Treponema sp.]|jgi:phosphoglycerate dehydrogenase-like enzyme|nr:hydroxyacid dehydrogenase [Treponema sp.]